MKKQKILVSACLLGCSCRYDGGNNFIPRLEELSDQAELIPFCPEIYGGLPTPRMPAEIRGKRVVTKDGRDVTEAFERGAAEAVRIAEMLGCTAAVLKERSPSCGSSQVYDGSFSGKRIDGNGVTAGLLRTAGIRIFSESELEECRKILNL